MPASIIAGKPTAKIFNAGAALVITPIPKLINKSETMIGRANNKAPKKTIELQSTIKRRKSIGITS